MANLPIFDDLEKKRQELYDAIWAKRAGSQEVPELPPTSLPKATKASPQARLPQPPRDFSGPPTTARAYSPGSDLAGPPATAKDYTLSDQPITGPGGLASSDFDNLPKGTAVRQQPMGFLQNDPMQGGMDYKQRLYDYLNKRRDSQQPFEDEYKRLSENAGNANVANNLISGLAESASMAGSLAGRRSAVGNFAPLNNAIYGAEKQKADNLMGLRQLANREEIGDITLLRDTSRMGLDDLRRQKLYKDLEGKSQVSKPLNYFVPGKIPKMIVLDGEGNVKAIDLPENTKPTNESYTGIQTLYQGDVPVTGVLGTRSGEVTRTPMPGYKTMDQIEQRLREIDNEKKTAKDDRLAKLQDEELLLKKKRLKLDERKQNFTESKPLKEEKQPAQKRLSPTDISKLNEAKNSQNIINDLNGVIDKYQDVMGPIEGSIRSSSLVKPFDERAKLFDADIRRIRQVIGKLSEGGVLRKEDEVKYLEMLPNMSDTPKVARYKARQFGDMLRRDYENHVKMLGDQGYDTTGLSSGGGKSSPRKDLGQMTREEKLRELQEHQGAGR
jgi:hypothetical protein